MNPIATEIRLPHAQRPRHVPGEPALGIFILGDMCVFAVFFYVLGTSHVLQGERFNADRLHMNMTFGFLNTLALLTSSLCVASALHAARQGRRVAAGMLYLGAMALGLVFIVVKLLEYKEKIEAGIDPTTDDFYMYYFVFTGIHLLHVVVGMIALGLASARCASPATDQTEVGFLEGAGVYWHMVDLLWIMLFLLLYLF